MWGSSKVWNFGTGLEHGTVLEHFWNSIFTINYLIYSILILSVPVFQKNRVEKYIFVNA
jgi:hypothetical protein